MFKDTRELAAGIAFLLVLTTVSLAGCSSGVPQSTPSSSTQEPSVQLGKQSADQSTKQQQPGPSGQSRPPNTPDRTAVLNRAAEILGISSDEFIAAFQNAMPSAPPGQQGQQPPERPSGQEGGRPEPPSGQRMSSEFMTEIYEKMSEELNITVDDIARAMAQAETEIEK